MAVLLALALFAVSVAITLAAAGLFADRLDHIGPRIGLRESLTGLVTALAADAPEISSALIALAQGERRVSLGIVVGSNVFNLAAMIGLSAVLTGAVRVGRRVLAAEGAVALLVMLLAAGTVFGLLSPVVAMVGMVIALVPYLRFIARGTERAARALEQRGSGSPVDGPLWKPVALAFLAVALILLGSAGMVHWAVDVADRWHVPTPIVGALILAVLTSIPNSFTAVRLGLAHRGTAMVSETLNSNTINLAIGVVVPALFLSVAGVTGLVRFDFAWMGGMTLVALLLLARPRGADRAGGILLIGLYLGFVGVHAWAG